MSTAKTHFLFFRRLPNFDVKQQQITRHILFSSVADFYITPRQKPKSPLPIELSKSLSKNRAVLFDQQLRTSLFTNAMAEKRQNPAYCACGYFPPNAEQSALKVQVVLNLLLQRLHSLVREHLKSGHLACLKRPGTNDCTTSGKFMLSKDIS